MPRALFRLTLAIALLTFAVPAQALQNGELFPPSWRANIAAWAGDYAITRAPAPDGRAAIRFELRAGDCVQNTISDCTTFRERTELRSLIEPPVGSERWYQFSMFLPEDYPGIGLDEILGQFHDGDKPVLSNRIKDGVLRFVVQRVPGANAAQGTLPAGLLRRGGWTQFTYHCMWSAGPDGFLNVYVGGQLVFSYLGPNIDASQATDPYLKIGIYRSHLDQYAGGATPTAVLWYTDVETGTKGPVLSATLPAARSVAIGAAATAFVSMINATSSDLTGCRLGVPAGLPVEAHFAATDAANVVIGGLDAPVPIPAGAAQGFVIALTATTSVNGRDVPIEAACAETVSAASIAGLNTLRLTATDPPGPDMVAIGATTSGDGIVHLPEGSRTHFFSAAAINTGAASPAIVASVDDGGAGLPLTARICRTAPATGACLVGAPTPSATAPFSMATGEVATFAIHVEAGAPIAFAPSASRLTVRFTTVDGVTRGATSVAVCTDLVNGPCR